MFSIRAGDGSSAQWWVDRQKAVPVARAARRFGGGQHSAASLGATLTPGHIAIERAGDAADHRLPGTVLRQARQDGLC
jgi:hypothetical protein